MSPFDDDLRAALRERADYLPPMADPLAGVEQRARGIRRRRTAFTATAAAVSVAAAITIPVALLSGAHHATLPPPIGHSPTPTPSTTTSATPAPTNDAGSWSFRGDAAVARQLMAKAPSPKGMNQPIWAGTTPSGGWSAVIYWEAGAGDAKHLKVYEAHADGSNGALVRDDLLQPGTFEIDQQIPGDPENFIVVLAAPGRAAITYTAPNGSQHTTQAANGVAVLSRSAAGGSGTERLAVTSGDYFYRANLSAAGFVPPEVVSGATARPEHWTREQASAGLFDAWLRGDRVRANTFATPSAVTTLFAMPTPTTYTYGGGGCDSGAAPAPCLFTHEPSHATGNEFGLRFTVNGAASAGYRVIAVTQFTH